MPKLKRGPLQEFEEIPFDPDAIAELMRQGYRVFSDDDIDDEQFQKQDNLVRNAINIRIARDQWGDQKLQPERKRFTLRGARSLREDDPFSKRIQPPGDENGFDYLNIKPNPFLTNMPVIDPDDFMDQSRKGKSWET